MKKIIVLLFTSVSLIYSQEKVNTAEKTEDSFIYEKIIDTINPQLVNNNKWIINDPDIVIQLYRILIPDGKSENDIITGKVSVEIEMGERDIKILKFIGLPENALNTIFNNFQELKYLLGQEVYNKLKDKSKYNNYDTSTISAPPAKPAVFMLNFNMLNPSLLLTEFMNGDKNMTLSFVGQWGEDNIINPGWFSNEYMIGLNISSYGKTPLMCRSNTRPEWSIQIGTTIKKTSIITANLPPSPIIFSGEGIHLKLTGKPFTEGKNIFKKTELQFIGKFNFSTYGYTDYGKTYIDNIITNNNYFGIYANTFESGPIGDWGDLKYGAGIMFYDIHTYILDPQNQTVVDMYPGTKNIDKYRSIISAQIGVEKLTNHWSHDFQFILSYEPAYKYGYMGFKFNFFVNDTFGFDLRYFRTYTGPNPIPAWRSDEYFVFSPILRIGN